MMNRGSEEEQLTMVVKNLLPIYCKYLFAQYLPNFKALIATGTQIEDAINNGTIKNEDSPMFKKNLGSSSKTAKVSNIYKNDHYQLIAPIASIPISQGPPPRLRREFHVRLSTGRVCAQPGTDPPKSGGEKRHPPE